jgi:hypothetical protein
MVIRLIWFLYGAWSHLGGDVSKSPLCLECRSMAFAANSDLRFDAIDRDLRTALRLTPALSRKSSLKPVRALLF